MEAHGEYDESLVADLVEGKLAAEAIMERAQEAVDKEHRVEAVAELQGRVEDWKGHRIQSFGELLLFGTYTVLKGEGAKEVEREVSEIFSILDPKSRALIRAVTRHALIAQAPPKVVPANAKASTVLGDRKSRYIPVSGVSKVIEINVREARISSVLPETIEKEVQIARKEIETLETSSDIQLKLAICNPQHLLQFNGPFSRSTCFLFHHVDLPPRAPHLSELEHAALFPPSTVKTQRERAKVADSYFPTKLEQQVIDELRVNEPEREQYKVYLFEKILLCCKEINPNKPKNKMLGTNKPLVDKKGKLKLQLKGRIFMQNVTDVLTLKRAGESFVEARPINILTSSKMRNHTLSKYFGRVTQA